jgi:hypothetical protein
MRDLRNHKIWHFGFLADPEVVRLFKRIWGKGG